MWDTKYYDMLQNTVAGGKGKMKWHFGKNDWAVATKEGPVAEADRDRIVDELQVCGCRAVAGVRERGGGRAGCGASGGDEAWGMGRRDGLGIAVRSHGTPGRPHALPNP